MTVPTVVGTGTAVQSQNAVSPSVPAHLQDDIVLIVAECAEEAGIPAPSGFAHVPGSPLPRSAGSDVTTLNLMWMRAPADDPAPTAPTLSDPGNHTIAQTIVLRGCETSGNPWDFVSAGATGTGNPMTGTGGTTTVADCLVVYFFAQDQDLSGAEASGISAPSLTSVTERMDFWGPSLNGGGIAAGSGVKATPGATGNMTMNVSTAGQWANLTIAFKEPQNTAVTGSAASTLPALTQAAAAAVPQQTINEDFNATDGPLGSALDTDLHWRRQIFEHAFPLAINGNQVTLSSTTEGSWEEIHVPYPSVDGPDASISIEVTDITITDTGEYVADYGGILRYVKTGANDYRGYACAIGRNNNFFPPADLWHLIVFRIDGVGVVELVGSQAFAVLGNVALPGTFTFSMVDDVIVARFVHSGTGDDLVINAVDSTYTDGVAVSGGSVVVPAGGSCSISFDNFSATTDFEMVFGSVASSLPALTSTATGDLDVETDAASTLPALTQSATGTVLAPGVNGSIASVLPALTSSATGDLEVEAAAASVLPALAQVATGNLDVEADAASTLPALQQAASGSVDVNATAALTLPALTTAASVTVLVPVTGTIAATLPALAQAAVAFVGDMGDRGEPALAIFIDPANLAEFADAGATLLATDGDFSVIFADPPNTDDDFVDGDFSLEFVDNDHSVTVNDPTNRAEFTDPGNRLEVEDQ